MSTPLERSNLRKQRRVAAIDAADAMLNLLTNVEKEAVLEIGIRCLVGDSVAGESQVLSRSEIIERTQRNLTEYCLRRQGVKP